MGGVAIWSHVQDSGWWQVWSMQGDPFRCFAVAWSPDGRSLATSGAHGIVRVWPHWLLSETSSSWCVTLRRWRSGEVTSLEWGHDGTLLVVVHRRRCTEFFARLWNTLTWEIVGHINLGTSAVTDAHPSVAWCSNVLFGVAGGQLFEVCGLSGSKGGFGPITRTVQMPQLQMPSDTGSPIVEEIAVCPRTFQRVAVRLKDTPHVPVFECLAVNTWVKQDIILRGLVSASHEVSSWSAAHDERQLFHAMPRALAFAGNATRHCSRDMFLEGSLLSVYWESPGGVDLRTYPMHYLPFSTAK